MKIDLLTTTALEDELSSLYMKTKELRKRKIGSADIDIFRNNAIDDTVYRLIPAMTRIAI